MYTDKNILTYLKIRTTYNANCILYSAKQTTASAVWGLHPPSHFWQFMWFHCYLFLSKPGQVLFILLKKQISIKLDNIPNLYWYKFPITGNLTGPGICLKAFVLLESAILILLEKDDKDLANENMMQLLKCLEHITAIFTSIYNLE